MVRNEFVACCLSAWNCVSEIVLRWEWEVVTDCTKRFTVLEIKLTATHLRSSHRKDAETQNTYNATHYTSTKLWDLSRVQLPTAPQSQWATVSYNTKYKELSQLHSASSLKMRLAEVIASFSAGDDVMTHFFFKKLALLDLVSCEFDRHRSSTVAESANCSRERQFASLLSTNAKQDSGHLHRCDKIMYTVCWNKIQRIHYFA